MWGIFRWFQSVYRKLVSVIDLVMLYIGPIYQELVAIIKEVKASDLEDDAARKAVFQKITDFCQAKGLNISDSMLNTAIELVYQLVKKGRA